MLNIGSTYKFRNFEHDHAPRKQHGSYKSDTPHTVMLACVKAKSQPENQHCRSMRFINPAIACTLSTYYATSAMPHKVGVPKLHNIEIVHVKVVVCILLGHSLNNVGGALLSPIK